MLAASVLWGTTGTAATFAPGVGPLAIGAAAMGLGGLLQALTAARPITRQRTALRAQRHMVLLGGAAVAVYPLAFYTSMRLAGVAVGTVVSIGSAPLASALAERVIDQHRLTVRWMLGAVLGLAGMVLLCLAEAARPHPGPAAARATMLGVALGLAAGMTYAIYSWAAHRLIGRGVTSRAAMGATFGLGGLLLLPVLLATGAPLAASWANAAVGAYLALVPMFTGYLLFGWALARVPVSTATTLSLLEPAVATVLAVMVVRESLPAAGWAGLILIAGCLAVLAARPAGSEPEGRSEQPRDESFAPALADGLVALVGPGQETGVAAQGGAHLLAAVSFRVGAEHERKEAPRLVQSGPDALGLTGRVQAGRVTHGHPADRDPGLRWHHAADVDGAAEGDAAGPAHPRAVEDHGAGGDEHLIADGAPGEVGVRAGQHVIADRELMPGRGPQHGVLHDHAVGADLHRAAIRADHRAVQHAAARAYPDLAAEHRR